MRERSAGTARGINWAPHEGARVPCDRHARLPASQSNYGFAKRVSSLSGILGRSNAQALRGDRYRFFCPTTSGALPSHGALLIVSSAVSSRNCPAEGVAFPVMRDDATTDSG